MTREEIIEGLKFTVDMFLLDPSTGETYPEPRNDMDKTTIDACKGAMELLEQEPCENAVSKQAVIDTIYRECSGENLDIDFAKILLLQRKIKALLPVTQKSDEQLYKNGFADGYEQGYKDAQQKTGRWIDDGFYADGWSHKAFHCSECGHNILGFKDDLKIECPNCGAKMQKSEDKE